MRRVHFLFEEVAARRSTERKLKTYFFSVWNETKPARNEPAPLLISTAPKGGHQPLLHFVEHLFCFPLKGKSISVGPPGLFGTRFTTRRGAGRSDSAGALPSVASLTTRNERAVLNKPVIKIGWCVFWLADTLSRWRVHLVTHSLSLLRSTVSCPKLSSQSARRGPRSGRRGAAAA